MRPGLAEVIAGTPGVAPYFDLSFQHASSAVLRRMRRFGGTDDFLGLLEGIRRHAPTAGARTNVIVGFPGETDADVEELAAFLSAASLDAVGVFGYSDEEGTEAVTLDGHLPQDEVDRRVAHISALVDELMVERAVQRIGEEVELIVEEPGLARAAHQGPEDAATLIEGSWAIGDVVRATITDIDGVDLVAVPR
jgi:ribosomal protein S12 methylthiotransferase